MQSILCDSLRLASSLLVLAACTSTPPADLIAVGRVWTGDSAQPWAQAVAVQGDLITAIGDSTPLLQSAGDGTRILRGAFVMPGFQDDHTHFLGWGETLASVDLRDADSPEEFTRRIAEYARRLTPGEWIRGGNWDHERFPGATLPRKEWVDSVTPDNPVMVDRYDGHMIFANSAALRAAGLGRSTGEVPGGEIGRDQAGNLTGIFRDAAMGLVAAAVPAPSESQLDSALARAMADAAQHGVTAVSFVSASWPEIAALKRAHAQGTLTLRVSAYPLASDWRNAAETLRVNGPGDDLLRVAGVKGMVDGSLGSTTAWFFQPYSDARHTSGLTVVDVDSLRLWIGKADSAGLQVVVHAIGDRANAWLLDVFDSVTKANGPRERRFKVEHAQHLRREEIARFAAMGVQASMQPYHAIDDGRWAEKRIGPERIKTTYAFRSLLDSGARLAFGSDAPVAPLDPIQGVYAAVTRQTLDGKNPDGWVPEEKITVEEALRAYTAANAWGLYFDRTGVLKAGMKADLVVLDQDIASVNPGQIKDAKVTGTVVGGRIVYEK
ncbi:MAG TPA: amidohydrolase [Gemmatimonadales bacterium]|nr:amidohydrolase [Gemmatimonadales bacterium]